jgi:hypothetical protein
MRISGFTMVRNATKLYYPIGESIASILPICDEFVVALGEGDADDRTREVIEGLGSDKIRIIDTVWDTEAFPGGTENAHQTDIALSECSGDWCFYLQADEVVHEADLPVIQARCRELLGDAAVEGLLFDYFHFWGDYDHYLPFHGWYDREIRIVRNRPDIHSWRTAQSFRRIPGFDGRSYKQVEGTHKLNVATAGAHIYHYGWVRPPRYMQSKNKALDAIHKGDAGAEAKHAGRAAAFDYGPLAKIPRFPGSHPAVMARRIAAFDWAADLRYDDPRPATGRPPFKHEKPKYRFYTWLEDTFLGGRRLFTSRNYRLLRR